MSKYTTELRYVCNMVTRDVVESWFKDYELSDYLSSSQLEVVNNAKLFNKDKLATEIVDNYFMREIGFETMALFKHYAKINMKKIMEKYSQLIYSYSLEYNPLVNIDYTETFIRDINRENNANGTSSSQQTNNGTALSVNSDTPQGQIIREEILNGKYASNTSAGESNSISKDDIQTQSNGSSKDNETYNKHTVGNSGVLSTNQKLIQQYRENILTIYADIINELNILFMGIY